ncbi:glycosyltransferase family 4 protein [Gammaproteobacteria bacterium]|nr:glycosyltransferase family 4 protein [Gammaproteobacteria bacterium]
MIVLDSIIYELQRAGGISELWTSILSHMAGQADLDFRVLDGAGAAINRSSPDGILERMRVVETGPLLLRRYMPARVPKDTKVFHSSYLRVANDCAVTNITTIHDFIYDKFDNGVPKLIHRKQREVALQRSELIICVSENTKTDLLNFYPELANREIRVIHNGVNPVYYEKGKPEDQSQIEAPYLLYVGGRGKHKNFSMCLDVLLRQDSVGEDLKLCVVGGGKFTREELKKMDRLGVKSKVRHLGTISDETLAHFYRNAFALIFPSFYEGFGIPPLEAMAAGCPVMCSDKSSIPEVVGKSGAYFDPTCIDSAVSALELLTDSKYRDEIIKSGLQRVKSFSWERTAKATVDAYRDYL